MIKISSLLSILMLFGITANAKSDTPDWKDCNDAATFAELVKQNADIRLTNDIDLYSLKKDGDYLFKCTFTGRIDGRNSDPTVLGGRNFALRNRQKSAKKDAIIFRKLDDAEITNLNIYQCDFDGLDEESGLLCDSCCNSTFDNLIFGDCQAVGDANTYDCDRMGFVAGVAQNSYFRNFFFTDCTMITDGSKLGLIAGEAKNCEFTLCSSNMGCELWADGNITSYNSAYVGGFCGYGDNCTFSKCYNFGAVMSDDDRIGGIIGFGTNCKIEDCKNVGGIMHCKKEGFGRRNLEIASTVLVGAGVFFGTAAVISYMLVPGSSSMTFAHFEALQDAYHANKISLAEFMNAPTSEFYGAPITITIGATGFTLLVHTVGAPVLAALSGACLAVGVPMLIYTLNDPDEMGGIAGTLEGGSSVLRCWNGGTIECGDEDCGGIVGHLDGSSVESCYNRTFVKSHGKCTGGIVGYCKNGTVIHNLNVGVVDSKSTPMDYIVGETNGNCNVAYNRYLYDSDNGDERSFLQEDLPSGLLALRMNIALTEAGKEAVWRQKLGEDFYPVNFDETRPIVTGTTDDYSMWQTVKTAEDFYLAVSNPLAKVSIEADLDLSNYIFNLATQAHPFKGEIKGNGHVLKNCHYATTDEYKDGNCALFPYAMDAKFENLILDGITISPLNSVFGNLADMAIFVAHSTRCEYKNITMRNCNILVNSDEDRLRQIGGLICHSNEDKITDCTIEGNCEFQSHVYTLSTTDSYLAGFAATAINSEFVGCHNAAKIKADDDRVAGIVADVTGGKIQNCLNSGQIIGQGELGGIAGIANNVQILKCVNVGGIDNDDTDHDNHRGGIVGYIKGGSSLIQDCLNFGNINWSTDERKGSGCIDGEHEVDGTYGTGNYWYCQFNGKHSSGGDDIYEDVLSGKYAFEHDFYQAIDNGIDFPTKMPVPIATAGKVYPNANCYWTQLYSNIYNSVGSHLPVPNDYGICSICGHISGYPVSEAIHISDAEGMIELARSVNRGINLSESVIYLDNDIDMSGHYCFPIGKDFDHPFMGTFDGQGHRIKNMSVNVANGCAGVFGCVSGTTVISNLIVDKTCQINASGYGAAGIVGCLALPSESSTESINFVMSACGNEASVSGDKNAAGLLGGVYNTDTNGNATVVIKNCYNVGTITGNEMSAALIGYGNKDVHVLNCYNAGNVTGYETDHSLIRCKDYTQLFTDKVYNLSTVANDVKASSFSVKELLYGKVCNNLDTDVWSQKLGTDVYPKLADGGVSYTRTLSNQWGTLVLPYNIESTDDVQYYSVFDFDMEGIWVKPVNAVEANTPCLFKVKEGTSALELQDRDRTCKTLESYSSVAEFGSAYEHEGKLIGTYVNNTISIDKAYTHLYINGNKFWQSTDEFSLPAFHVYLQTISSMPHTRAIPIMVEETGISDMRGESSEFKDGKYLENGKVVIIHNGKKYNLAGQIAL